MIKSLFSEPRLQRFKAATVKPRNTTIYNWSRVDAFLIALRFQARTLSVGALRSVTKATRGRSIFGEKLKVYTKKKSNLPPPIVTLLASIGSKFTPK